MEKDIERLYKKHKTWVTIVKSFGCNSSMAEDLVQEMYIKIILKMKDGLDIRYNENDINYFYIFRTLNSLYIDLKRKNYNVKKIDIDHVNESLLNKKNNNINIDYIEKYDIIKKELDKMYWYDKKVFEIINGGESIAALSRKTHIAYYSLYNTYTKVKNKLIKFL
tara:strand:+ start:1494 stop:1988 length:495 start_codon:yes stop_codon:yes gene_type:complete